MDTSAINFAALLAPFEEPRFCDEHFGKRPRHVPHDVESEPAFSKAELMTMARLAELLAEPSGWAQNSIKLVVNGRGVDPMHFMVKREFSQGDALRPDPALIETLMVVGATVVTDGIEDQPAELRQMCGMLGGRYSAKATVSICASRRGVQGFASHYDAARWTFAQPSFSWFQFEARFCHHPPEELQGFLAKAVSHGAFERRQMA